MKRVVFVMLGLAAVLSLLMASVSCGSPGAGPSVSPVVAFGATGVNVGGQQGTLTAGTAGSVQYTITILWSGGGPAKTLSVTGLPTGASGVFVPSSVSSATTSILTVSTTSATPSGVHTFTVSCSGHDDDGTLTIGGGGGCTDADGDGYGEGTGCSGTDCDDGDPNNWNSCGTCVDNDGDGYFTGCDDYDTIDGPDCDDDDPNNWSSCGTCVDNDGDGYFTGCDDYDTVDGPDCDDGDPNVWSSCGSCVDNDGDDWYVGCDDYDTIDGPDCDDGDPNNWTSCSTCVDNDGDGYFTGCDDYDTIDGPDPDDGDPLVPGGQTQDVVTPPKTWYTMQIDSTEGGRVTKPRWGFPYLGYYRYSWYAGEVVKLEAEPDAGYRFVNWTGDVDTIADVNASSTTITVNGFYKIKANFEAIT